MFIEAYIALPRFRQQSSILHWLLGIARNQCNKALREKQRNRYSSKEEEFVRYESHCSPSEYPGQRPSRKILAEKAWALLIQLTEEEREIVILHCAMKMTWEEIAHTLQISVSTVRRRWDRALLHLKTYLKDYIEE